MVHQDLSSEISRENHSKKLREYLPRKTPKIRAQRNRNSNADESFQAKGSLVQNALCVSNYESFVRKTPLLALQVLQGKGRN
jgi:hypothetical protein